MVGFSARRLALVSLGMLALAACDDPRRSHDDDDGDGHEGGAAGAVALDAGGAGGAGGVATSFGGEIAWQLELESIDQLPRGAAPDGAVYVHDDRYEPTWRVDRISPAGQIESGGGWPLAYTPANATGFESFAVGPSGELVLVGAEVLGWHTAKVTSEGQVDWFRVLYGADGQHATGASVDANGTITVVGSGTYDGPCVVARYLGDGTRLDDPWPKTLSVTAPCRRVLSDEERIYVPTGGVGEDGVLHIVDPTSGSEVAATPLPGAPSSGGEIGLFTLAPGGGVLAGHHASNTTADGRYLKLIDADGNVLWQQHLPETTGRVGARTDGTLVCSVTAPSFSYGTESVAGEVTVQWLRRIGDELVDAGTFSLGAFTNALVTNVIALADGSFVVSWGSELGSAPAESWHLARVRPLPES